MAFKERNKNKKAHKLIKKYCNELCLLNASVSAGDLFDYAKKHNFIDETTFDMAIAGSIYISALIKRQKRTQQEISELTGVSTKSIRKYYNFLISVMPVKTIKNEVKK